VFAILSLQKNRNTVPRKFCCWFEKLSANAKLSGKELLSTDEFIFLVSAMLHSSVADNSIFAFLSF